MIVAYGIDGNGYQFRFGVKGGRMVLKMPPFTAPFDWGSVEDIKRLYPNEANAEDGKWCWTEVCGSWMS